jgi:transcription elongation GreA/GreB family factor
MNKQAIRDAMLALELGKVAQAEHQYGEHLLGAARDASEPTDHDRLSQRVESAEVAEGFESSLHAHEQALARIRAMDFKPQDTIGPGALVKLNGQWLVVAEATSAFTAEGQTFMGISLDSPIYAAISGREAGETVEFDGRTLKIDSVQ